MINFNFKLDLLFLAGQYITERASSIRPLIKTMTRVSRFRTGWYTDDHEELERIFQAMRDPWNFESSHYEQQRLQFLFEQVQSLPHESVCEIGCAEGIFTQKLATVCRNVTAVDVSPTAIQRAKMRNPGPTYVVNSLEKFQPEGKFDLVICAETLYYIKEVPAAIRKLSSLGRHCLVSYLERESGTLDRHFGTLPDIRLQHVEFGAGVKKKRMVYVTWTNPDRGADACGPGDYAPAGS